MVVGGLLVVSGVVGCSVVASGVVGDSLVASGAVGDSLVASGAVGDSGGSLVVSVEEGVGAVIITVLQCPIYM